ncbi:hypothetical protein TKK_0017128 [Trichogramma kaykai]
MRNDIQNFIRKCPEFQERKIVRAKTRQPMLITDTPIEAFDKVFFDTVGKLRMTPEENCHLLTMQCNLTKYLIAIPIPNLRATTIADALARHLICQFGAPHAILSDEGTSFLADIVETLMRFFKIRHLTTSAYRPQTNGALERSHAPLIDFIRTYSKNYDDWDKLAPFTTFEYNTSVHSATNFTPYQLVPLKIPTEDRLPTYNLYLQDLITRLTEMKNLTSDKQQHEKQITKKRYDKKARLFKGSPGDYAWVLNEPHDDGPPNPGLYYEQQDTVFLRKATWRVIVVHLNLEPYSEEHNLYSNYYELMHECRDNLGEEFCEFFDNKGDGNKQQTIDALKKSIKQAKKPTEGSKSEVQRKKRSAPLTIIGSLSHGLFGTAIEEEIELVQRNLDQLFRDQKTMIRLNN